MTVHATFQGRLVMLGFGSIGQGVLPLILRHIAMAKENIRIVSGDDRGAAEYGVKVIHIAERDTQTADLAKQPGEFVNTWSIDGFVGEGNQPAELGWGTHEKALPGDGAQHDFG